MARMPRKPCLVDADPEVKQEILDCRHAVRQEIGEFLYSLQFDPLPEGRVEKARGAFYKQLPCGIFVVWEIVGDLLDIALHGPDEKTLVRIIGVGWEVPPAP
jgi:hypothetical protein